MSRVTSSHILLMGFALVVCMGLIFLCASLMLSPVLGDSAPIPTIPPSKVLRHATAPPKDPPSTPGLLDDRAMVMAGQAIMDGLSKKLDKLAAEKKVTFGQVLDPALFINEFLQFKVLFDKAADPYGMGASQARRMYFTVLVHCGLYRQAGDLVNDMIPHTSGDMRATLRGQLASMLYQHHQNEQLDALLADLKRDPGASPDEIRDLSSLCQAAHVVVGRPFPDFSLPDSHGAIHRLGDYVGHPLLIVVWVSVHPDFLADLPALERVRDGYGPRGLALLGIDCDISPKHADALPMQMKCPQVIGRQQWQERVVAPFGITSLPMYFLVSAQGMLLQKASRIADLADKLNAAFAAP